MKIPKISSIGTNFSNKLLTNKKLLRGLDCRVNLIRFHAIPGSELEGCGAEQMTAFRDYLTAHGLFATIRASRGEDIFAACGMLSTAKQEQKK